MTKEELRRIIRALKRERLSDEAAFRNALPLTAHPCWLQAKTVLLYHPLPDEVDTRPLLQQAAGTKCLLLPVVVGGDLVLREYSGKTMTGAFGIEEPVGQEFTDYDKIELAVVPGMAFAPTGQRLGRGKGYYDRLLPRLKNAYKIGLCYSWQIMSEIPVMEHDILMDDVVRV